MDIAREEDIQPTEPNILAGMGLHGPVAEPWCKIDAADCATSASGSPREEKRHESERNVPQAEVVPEHAHAVQGVDAETRTGGGTKDVMGFTTKQLQPASVRCAVVCMTGDTMLVECENAMKIPVQKVFPDVHGNSIFWPRDMRIVR